MNCLGKGYKIRGCAYKKLGMWCEAHADLQTGLRLDFDEGIEAGCCKSQGAASCSSLQACKARGGGFLLENECVPNFTAVTIAAEFPGCSRMLSVAECFDLCSY